MLEKKKVVIGRTDLHLWDEANNFLGSFNTGEHEAMCQFLVEMVDRRFYTEHPETEAPSGLLAQAPPPAEPAGAGPGHDTLDRWR